MIKPKNDLICQLKRGNDSQETGVQILQVMIPIPCCDVEKVQNVK